MRTTRDEEFRAFVVEHRPAMVRTAVLLTAGDRHAAEDLVQTALTKVYVRWTAFRRVDSPRTYVRRVMVNALVDETRRPWRRREVRVAEVPERAAPVAADGPAAAVVEALQQLPPRMRGVVVLRYFEDLSVAQCAEVLGCSQGTVKSQTSRALDHLRASLGADLDPQPPTPTAGLVPALSPEARHD